MSSTRFLVLGAGGQIGTELCETLAAEHGADAVLAADLRPLDVPYPFATVDVADREAVFAVIEKHKPEQIYHLAALLSATGEKKPALAWRVNMDGLLNVLDAAIEHGVQRIFWPSSIAVFGPTTPRVNTPQDCIMDPNTMYGITKLAGERLCAYYHSKFGLDVRSLRYPGLISYKADPGGGTTDYAVEIYYKALQEGSYTSFLGQHTRLPMMYMLDAIKATLGIMAAPPEAIKVRSSYNLAAMSFTPAEMASAIRAHVPGFDMHYEPDYRQAIADSWPESIDDSAARAHWGWAHAYDLPAMTQDMLHHLALKLNVPSPIG